MRKFTNDELFVAEALTDLIEKVESEELKYNIAEARYDIVCQHSGLGEYKCSMRPPFSHGWECDLCLEPELFKLWKEGVHTVSSCCGHGIVPPYIQVLRGESVQKMHELGYEAFPNKACPDNPNPTYHPKTYLPCFSPCKECAMATREDDYDATVCTAGDYDINRKWCFVPKPPEEGCQCMKN